jgi:rubrerythrin
VEAFGSMDESSRRTWHASTVSDVRDEVLSDRDDAYSARAPYTAVRVAGTNFAIPLHLDNSTTPMETAPMKSRQLPELLLQSLEHERGGVKIYRTALKCAVREDLREEWSEYLEQTTKHVEVLTELCHKLKIDPGVRTPGCMILHDLGTSLVQAMEKALAAGNPKLAQIVACECIVLAETKDHADWELIGRAAKGLDGSEAAMLREAYQQVEPEEDEHLYHTKGWCRELWLEALGLEAVLPPPEETQNVDSAIEAAKTSASRLAG